MSSRFSEENRPGHDLFFLIPSIARLSSDLGCMNAKLMYWKDDIPLPVSLINEIKEWKRHWTLQPPEEDPDTFLECYLAADEDRFPNIKTLLKLVVPSQLEVLMQSVRFFFA